jgi:hypothetical protein
VRNFGPHFDFYPLPCGCVSDIGEIILSGDIVGCPWCDATFSEEAYNLWLRSDASPIVEQRMAPIPKTLIKASDRVLEVVGWHGCGAPLVRELGGKTFHLAVPPGDVETLLD